MKYMKLSSYAKKMGIHYGTALRHWHRNMIKGYQDKTTGTIYVEEEQQKETKHEARVALYSRVSSNQNKNNLLTQSERLQQYAVAKGYTIVKVVNEIASGLNDKRPKLEELLMSDDYDILIVEHKDRLTRFGFHYIDVLLQTKGKKVEVINMVNEEKEDLMNDLISIITSFCSRIYGQRRCKRKTELIIQNLKKEDINNENESMEVSN